MSRWCICSLMSGMKKYKEKGKQIDDELLRELCNVLGLDYEECAERFGKENENAWLTEVIGKKKVSFRDACEYLGEPEIYGDFQSASSFVHGQDIISKWSPFTFYSSICHRLFLMMSYIFRTIRLYTISGELEDEMETLEEELWELLESYAK